MFITKFLNRRHTDDTMLHAHMGIPVVTIAYRGTPTAVTVDGETVELSDHASQKWSLFSKNKITHFFDPDIGRKSVYGGPLTAVAIGAFSAVLALISLVVLKELSLGFLTNALITLVVLSLPNEIWTAISVARLKIITKYTKDELKKEAEQIISENQLDLDLMQETASFIDEYKSRLSTTGVTTSNESRIDPKGTNKWRVADVQYHSIGKSPFDRDASITLSSDESDAITCVLPGEDTVTDWLNAQLAKMRRQVKKDTHAYCMLMRIDASDILRDVWNPPSEVFAEIAKMIASSKLPFEERAPVSLYGEVLPGGQVMTHAIGIDSPAKETSNLVFAPTGPVLELSKMVEQHLFEKGQHPTLLVAEAA